MTSPVFTPLQMFYSTSGLPLTDGYIYIGTASQNPQTNPIAVYWDAAGTIPAAQPIRTSGGYPVRNGSPATVFVLATDFSLIVRDKSSKLVFSRLSGNAFSAEWVTYTPAGTGAVTTTVQAKLRESVSVKDFGAVGDGVTDDTAAIQAAINYCTSLSNRKQTLYFPANNAATSYRITASLVITGRLNIIGDGEFSTTIYADGFSAGQYILNFDNLDASVVYFGGVRGITLRGSNTNARGIRLNNASYWTLKNVQLFTLGVGVYLTGTRCFSNFFEQVTGYGISFYTVQFDSFTGGGQYQFLGCTFTGANGVYVSNTASTDGLAFYDCNFEQCTTTDAYVAGTVSGLTFSGCRSEGLDGERSFLIQPDAGKYVRGLTVTGCTWATDFGNAYAVDIGGDVSGFSITGNHAGYIGFLAFVRLNGAGAAGVISGNQCDNSPAVVSATRAGVVMFANYNSSGALPDYWGTANWEVKQSTYTATATGMTTSPTGTVKYSVVGNTVTLDIPGISGTSNATTFTLTGGPTDIRPAVDKDIPVRITDNGTQALGFVRVKTTGVLELYATVAGNSFTGSGAKAVAANSISYTLA